ncbi:hypothetical protein ACFQL1_13985 [Halomicroarcula sp. GCM10025709]|uniref:hypothetical protein n=1 Tax=Haloarcula TaxID=2237 RepID=UPI0024C42BE3|nr:hypothetical protein [Halomicroarcula sp. YJ-61-S]
MLLLAQAGPGVGDLLVIALLLVAMVIPVVLVLGVAVYITRDEWTGDRKDHVDKELSADRERLGAPDADDQPGSAGTADSKNGE